MTNMSRRSVTKGAAWSMPAIAVTAGAPLAAASTSYPPINCSTVPALSDTGLKSLSYASGTQSSYDQTSGHSDAKAGSFLSINAGMWQFTAPASYVTGYKLSYGSYVGVTTVDGTKSRGSAQSGGVTTPQVIGAGLSQAFATQTGVPYRLVAKKAYNAVQGVSIPFTITYLAGLTGTSAGTEVGSCSYFINYTFNETPDVFGNYPDGPGVANSGDAYSVTTTAQYGN